IIDQPAVGPKIKVRPRADDESARRLQRIRVDAIEDLGAVLPDLFAAAFFDKRVMVPTALPLGLVRLEIGDPLAGSVTARVPINGAVLPREMRIRHPHTGAIRILR